jgi:hypothetical protein
MRGGYVALDRADLGTCGPSVQWESHSGIGSVKLRVERCSATSNARSTVRVTRLW